MSGTRAPILLAWSSGKDSAWSLHVLRQDPSVEVVGLLTTINEAYDRVAMHAVRRALLEAQADAASLPLVLVRIPSPCSKRDLRSRHGGRGGRGAARAASRASPSAISSWRTSAATARNKMSRDGPPRLHFPLWGRPTAALAEDMIGGGLQARLPAWTRASCPRISRGAAFDRDAPRAPAQGRGPLRREWRVPHLRLGWPDVPACRFPCATVRVVSRDGFVFADLLPRKRREQNGWGPSARVLSALLLAAATLGAAPAASSAPAPPQRIASLNLTADEVLVEILPWALWSPWPPPPTTWARRTCGRRVPPTVARFRRRPTSSAWSRSRPTFVVVSEYTDPDFLYLLERSGLRYHPHGRHAQPGRKPQGHPRPRRAAVGAAAGREKLVAGYDAVLADLARRLDGVARPRVMYWASGMTAGADTAIGALIESAGARNVGAEIGVAGIGNVAAERVRSQPIRQSVLIGVVAGARKEHSSSIHSSRGCARCARTHRGDADGAARDAEPALARTRCWYLAWALHPDRVPGSRP